MNLPPAAWKPDLKAAGVLGLAAALATAALFPYLLQLMPDKLAQLPAPLPVMIVAQSLQALVLLGGLSLLGLRMGHRVGLGAPLLQAWLGGAPAATRPRLQPWLAVALGVATALLVALASQWIDPLLPAMRNPPAHADAAASALNGLLASFYGGIAEELQLRLFLMTLLVWLLARVRRRMPGNVTFWLAILLAALLFGVGHLPAAAHIWGLDAVVVLRTLALNAVVGIACGWLYWRRGLEMAMLAHFSADIMLHVLIPLLGSGAP
ncbi:MAG: CPBP family glutamic-type intramembrane protease [Stenotrophomonas sp.]